MKCDEFGIISGRGRSKYLGVSTTKTFPGYYIRLYIQGRVDPLVYRLHPQITSFRHDKAEMWASLAVSIKSYFEHTDVNLHLNITHLIVYINENYIYKVDLSTQYIHDVSRAVTYDSLDSFVDQHTAVLEASYCIDYYRNLDEPSQSTMDLTINDYEKVKKVESIVSECDIVQQLYTKIRNGELSYDQLEDIRLMTNLAHKYDSFT